MPDTIETVKLFKHYNPKNAIELCGLKTALEILKSLMDSLGVYEVNPYGDEEPKKQNPQLFGNSLAVKTLEWKKAQANTGKWVLLIETK